MFTKLRKIFVPHESNNYHPHTTRYTSILGYAIALALLNYFVFPALGISYSTVKASSINTQELITLANNSRRQNGLDELKENSLLSQAALLKGNNMLQQQYWAHFGPNNETPWQFIKQSGYTYVYAGENLAKDFYSDIDAHTAWMNSKTHRENILNENFSEIGIATVSGLLKGEETTIIVVLFATPFDINSNITLNNPMAPLITKPLSGTILNDQRITIEGKAGFGDTLKVFSNGKLIGELPKDDESFTVNVELSEKINELYIKSKDSKTSEESQSSNTIKIDINPNTESQKVYGISTTNLQDGPVKRIINKYTKLSLGEKINSIIIFVISLFVLIDLIVLAIKGIKRDSSSHHSFHLALIVIVSIGIITI